MTCPGCGGHDINEVTALDVAGMEPDHLRELADLIEAQRAERLEKLMDIIDQPSLGHFRRGRGR